MLRKKACCAAVEFRSGHARLHRLRHMLQTVGDDLADALQGQEIVFGFKRHCFRIPSDWLHQGVAGSLCPHCSKNCPSRRGKDQGLVKPPQGGVTRRSVRDAHGPRFGWLPDPRHGIFSGSPLPSSLSQGAYVYAGMSRRGFKDSDT